RRRNCSPSPVAVTTAASTARCWTAKGTWYSASAATAPSASTARCQPISSGQSAMRWAPERPSGRAAIEGGKMSGVQRLAIVNRGEPAMRCLAAVGDLGDDFGEPITTIALYTDPDAASLFVRQADEAVPLGPALVTDSDGSRHGAYVDIDKVTAALARARADAVWVGWGFVAESA